MDKMAIYNHLPIWGQNLACYIEGNRIKATRYGRQFWSKLKEYEERDFWSYEKKCEYRDRKLRKMVKHAYETVPYYRSLFDEGGINPDRIRRIEDLKSLPILTKEIINNQPARFLSNVIPKRKIVSVHTSGTTGAGFIFKSTQEAICEQWAVWWRYRKKIGIDLDEKCALFGGRSVVPVSQSHPPYYRINKPGKQIYFSVYHLSDKNMESYLEALEKYKPAWIHGYPSAISIFANYMIEHEKKLSYKVKWITCGAENLLEQQKELISKAFEVVPYQHYGLSEGVANISESREHALFIDEDFSCVELIENVGMDGVKIVGTNLTNYAMPFIRYDTGDYVSLDTGNRRNITAIDGRKEDYITLSNGAIVGRLDHIFKDMINVKEAQVKQDKKGNITFIIVKGSGYSVHDENRLKKEIEYRIGKEQYKIIYSKRVNRTQSGKLRFVVSEKDNSND